MNAIVLTTLNARYIHSSISLRYLKANLGELEGEATLMEFVVADRPVDIAEKILSVSPRVVAIAVYIWNALEVSLLIRVLRSVDPNLVVVLGGPEVSHPPLRIHFEADYIVMGEGETAFYRLCRELLSGKRPPERLIVAQAPELLQLQLPYEQYSDEDVRHRVVYLEASRGCPFACEFCLSSIEKTVRYFDLQRLLMAVDRLWERGVRHFKFIDRSFNLNPRAASALMDFFLDQEEPYMLHFEMVPTALPLELRDRLKRFPAGRLQLEVGIQTLNPEVAERIGRAFSARQLWDTVTFLCQETGAHLHFDLILGLPGETLESMAQGLDRLMRLNRGEIQLGILKKLSGTELVRHDGPFGMVFSPLPPYELLQSALLPFSTVQALKRMARFWDLCFNSGRFRHTLPLLWPDGQVFNAFFTFSSWLYAQLGVSHQIALERLAERLSIFLIQVMKVEVDRVKAALERDQNEKRGEGASKEGLRLPKRQGRHRRD